MTALRGDQVVYLLGDLAREFGCSPSNARKLSDGGRLPMPAHRDPVSGYRYWTEEEMAVLREWNRTRIRQVRLGGTVTD